MIYLHRVSKNPFATPRTSISCLQTFTSNHLARMKANNSGGLFTARIAATEAAFATLSNSFIVDETKLALRKAHKLEKKIFRAALPVEIGKIHGAVVARFGAKAAELTECFPSGRRVFGKCRDVILQEELQTLIDGLTAHAAELGAGPLAQAQALRAAWLAVYDPSLTARGNKAASMQVKRTARAALQLELFRNLLTIALNYPDQPAMVKLYMQQSLLTFHAHPQGDPEPVPAT